MNITRRKILAGGLAAAIASLPKAAGGAPAPAHLKDLAAARGILYGSCVTAVQLSDYPEYAALVSAECSCIVPEAEMKWGETSEKRYENDYSAPDRVVNFASDHQLLVRGHNLLWYGDSPDWYAALSRAEAEAEMLAHITEVCQRYRGKVFCWDVVNEPINLADQRGDGLRRAVFLETIGPEYLHLAHAAARAADPDACLVLNEYGIEYDTVDHRQKRRAVLHLLETMKKMGTPVDALGIEAHLTTDAHSLSLGEMRRFLSEVAAMGLAIHITELDVNDEHAPGLIFLRDRLVADEYERFLDVVLDEPAVSTVVTWGLSDRYSWIDMDDGLPKIRRADGQPIRALPYDRTLAPKPARSAIARAFKGAPSRSSPVTRCTKEHS